MIGETIGLIEEIYGSKYLVFDSANENEKVFKKNKQLWDGIKNETETIILTIVVSSVEDEDIFDPQVYLDGCLYEL